MLSTVLFMQGILCPLMQVINAAPDLRVDLVKERKPLTLNMEFEMTRPMLDFLIRLHRSGENTQEKVCILQHSRM